MKHIVQYTSPTGEIFYDAYGPMVTDIAKATAFNTKEAAQAGANNRFGHGPAFWSCEINHNLKAREQYRQWSFKVLPALPDLHPETIGEPIIERFEQVAGTFRYSIRPASAGPRGDHPFSVISEALYDDGTLIPNLWSSHRTEEEARDKLRYLQARARGEEYKERLTYEHNNLSGWTKAAAEIEARKHNSPKRRNGYRWDAIPAPHLGSGRYMLRGTLIQPATTAAA